MVLVADAVVMVVVVGVVVVMVVVVSQAGSTTFLFLPNLHTEKLLAASVRWCW